MTDAPGDLGAGRRNPLVALVGRVLLTGIVVFSVSNFNPALFGGTEEGGLQQVIVLALWTAFILMSFTQPTISSVRLSGGTMLLLGFYAYAFASVGWSSDPGASAAKAVAFLLTTLGAWRLHAVLTLEEFFDCTFAGLAALAAASVALVILVPSIGVLSTWQHSGQWAGIFVTKQNLGTASALLALLALVRFIHKRQPASLAALALGLAAVLGSGSRGAAAIAVTAVTGVLAARYARAAATFIAIMPLLMLLIGSCAITALVVTGYPYLLIGDEKVDLTERTLIWQYALSHWTEVPVLGTGLNGFWSNPDVYFRFLREHEWVLDNYHSGYVSILVELGLVGMVLFLLLVAATCRALRQSLSRSEADRSSAYTTACAAGFVVLFFTINLTETFLLRSTNFLQSMFTFVLLSLFSARAVTTSTPPRRLGWLSQGTLPDVGEPDRDALPAPGRVGAGRRGTRHAHGWAGLGGCSSPDAGS